MDWSSIFDESRPGSGASDADIGLFVAAIGKPLSEEEVAEVNRNQRNPFPASDPFHAAYRPFDPSRWEMPKRPLPADFLSFLRWCNGGWCRTGDREFRFFPISDPAHGVREMTLAYHLPQHMPGALPFAFNGGGTFYLFDMREQADRGNYPVVCAHAGALGWGPNEHWVVADSVVAAFRGSVNVDDCRKSESESELDARELVAVYLEQPLKSLKTLILIKEHLGISTSIAELNRVAQSPPGCISDGLTYGQAMKRCAKVNAIEHCLGIRLLRDRDVCLPLTWQG